MVTAQHLHQLILNGIDVLKLIDHDVLQPLLPLEPDLRILLKEVQGEFEQIVVVQSEAFLLLIEVSVKDDISGGRCLVVLLLQSIQGKCDEIPVVLRLLDQLAHLNEVPGGGKGHVPQGQPPFFIEDLQHGINIRVVQYQKAFGIMHRVAVFLKDTDAKTMESIDVAGIVVAGKLMDTLPHFRSSLVGKGDA